MFFIVWLIKGLGFCFIKNTKCRKVLDGLLFGATQIREFITGFVIFDILTCAIYEASVNKAFEKPFSSGPYLSLILSYIVIFAYIAEIMLMWYMASKFKLKEVKEVKKVKII